MEVTGRFIDKNAWHVVITRHGDIVQHHRFDRLTDADAFADEIEAGGTVGQALGIVKAIVADRLAVSDPTKLGRPW